MFPEQPSQEYRLAPGRTLLVRLPAASELRCVEGQARIVPAPLALGEVLSAASRSLGRGQVYRCAQAQWLMLEAAAGGGRLLCSQLEAAHTPQKQNRLVAQAARRLQDWARFWIRRAPRAASSRNP